MPKVSVIIPVYKAEPYIERCVRTLFGQTLDDLEFIFVDDCSPDHSIEVMERVLTEYPHRQEQVKVIRHDVNQGVSSARQHGVDAATGEYIIHCDPDDWVELDMYDRLFKYAIATNADVVLCDYHIEHNSNRETIRLNVTTFDAGSILSKLVEGTIIGVLWNKLVKTEYITNNRLSFPSGLNICEDLVYCLQIMSIEPKISYLNAPLYHYDKYSNPNSLTLLSNRHNKSQYLSWMKAYNDVIKDHTSIDYATGYTYIAYWAFTHNLLSKIEFKAIYKPQIKLLWQSNRNLGIKIITILSALGMKNILWDIYKLAKRL